MPSKVGCPPSTTNVFRPFDIAELYEPTSQRAIAAAAHQQQDGATRHLVSSRLLSRNPWGTNGERRTRRTDRTKQQQKQEKDDNARGSNPARRSIPAVVRSLRQVRNSFGIPTH